MRWLFRSVMVGILGGVATTVLALAALGCSSAPGERAGATHRTDAQPGAASSAAPADAGR